MDEIRSVGRRNRERAKPLRHLLPSAATCGMKRGREKRPSAKHFVVGAAAGRSPRPPTIERAASNSVREAGVSDIARHAGQFNAALDCDAPA